MGVDTQREDFTVVGVGDMSGDVFGNGMLLSPHIRLIAAFNHLHVFVDPTPDAMASFKERRRLFDAGVVALDAYEPALISQGGGVFQRSAKSIGITEEMKAALAIEEDRLTPGELISRILKAPVDLLWNGGIGTFVKARDESHGDADDRTNDAVRVDGRELRCRVVGEGGNLGFTQAGRIEYAKAGGRINTDFIDNSGGVDCSDHEVNIKILLNGLVAAGDLTTKHRNECLEEMTDEVTELVLRDNYQQAQAVSIAEVNAVDSLEAHARMLRTLELSGRLDRALEGLPSDEEIADRKVAGLGFTRPELAVILAYAKIDITEALVASHIANDPYFSAKLQEYFPRALGETMGEAVREHRLRRQIIATTVTNSLVNRTGPSFAYRLAEGTGARLPEVVRAYVTTRDVFRLRSYWSEVEALDGLVEPRVQIDLFRESVKLLEQGTRWFLRHCDWQREVGRCVDEFGPGADQVADMLSELLQPDECERTRSHAQALIDADVPTDLARRAARLEVSFPALDIVDASRGLEVDLGHVAELYFRAGDALGIDWLRSSLAQVPTENHWHRLAQDSAADEMHRIQRAVAMAVLREDGEEEPMEALSGWMHSHRIAVERLQQLLNELRGAGSWDWAMIGVALREARRLAEPD
jgi:glutamate dehydrogenase